MPSLIPSSTAELGSVRSAARIPQVQVRRTRRPTPADPWTEAPTRDVLGLSVLGLDPEVDAALIEGRNTLYKWITACTQVVLWEVHSESDDTYKVDYGANWGKIGPTRRQFLIDTYGDKILSLPIIKPIFFFPDSVEITSVPGGFRSPSLKPRSVFEDDWPIQKMLREALKNER
ncbi:hypothetical protein NCC49_005986 [Naganishia albida]|nr:hypothetical protein NCC49_005986 [Naganishia albida]